MKPITETDLREVVERTERGEDLARRRSPQPNILADYYRARNEQQQRLTQYLEQRAKGERGA